MRGKKVKIKESGILGKFTEDKKNDLKGLNFQINFTYNVEKILFARILATLLRSGINIADALVILEEQFVGKFKRVVSSVRGDIESGQSLAKAIQKHPKFFNKVYVGLVNVGETSGRLIETLEKVAQQQEKDLELKRKVQSASFYPVIVLLCLIGLAALLSFYILPQLVVVFASFYMSMPWTTQLLLKVAGVIRDYGFFILIALIVIVILIRIITSLKSVRPYWQGFLMVIPFVGDLIKKLNLARFSRILGVLLESGVPVNKALNTTIESLDNEVYKRLLSQVRKKVISGLSLGEAIEGLDKQDIFPKLVTQMISVGERTGTLEGNLIYLAEFYEKEIDHITKNLSVVIEPVLLVVVGIVVTFLAVAIISPIYEFVSTLSNSI